MRYTGNRFSWLGNGMSQTELDPESDLGCYIRTFDDDPPLSRDLRRQRMTRVAGHNGARNEAAHG